ncbi:MAG: hypothetical protein EXR79_17695 [Myxococcales bacterium]|nr:hypothetical protein [Myxococcales bacterium]
MGRKNAPRGTGAADRSGICLDRRRKAGTFGLGAILALPKPVAAASWSGDQHRVLLRSGDEMTKDSAAPTSAPPTAYESFQRILPRIDEVALAVAAEARAATGGNDFALIAPEDIAKNSKAERYIHDYAMALYRAGWSSEAAAADANIVGHHIEVFANHELHRRKTFWVDPPLA